MDAVLAGEAGAEEREALDRLSAADPAVRDLIESRKALFAALRQVPLAEPPADLRDSIREAVRRERMARGNVAAREAAGNEDLDVSTGLWARLFHPKKRRSQMPNKKWILGGAAAVAVVVAFIALRNPNPGSNAQGTIGAANRYQSPQVSSGDVSLDNPQMASFLQSDTFRKLASSEAFRDAAKSDAFGRFVASDALRDASAKYDLAKVLDNASVTDLFKSDVFAQAMTEARISDGLHKADLARLIDSAHLTDLLKMDALRDVSARADFIKLANDAARMDARSIVDLGKLADPALKATDAYKALEANKYFADALQAGFMDLFRSPEGAKFAVDGLRQLVDSAHLGEALRVDGFKSVLDGLNADTFGAVRDLAKAPEMLSVLSDASYRDAAKYAELGKAAEVGFAEVLAKMPE